MKRKGLLIVGLTATLCFSGMIIINHSSSRVEAAGILDAVSALRKKVTGGIGSLKELIIKVVQGLVVLFKQFNEKIRTIGYKDKILKISSAIPLPEALQGLLGREKIDIGLIYEGLPSGAGEYITEGFDTVTAKLQPKIDIGLKGLGVFGSLLPNFNLGATGVDAIDKLRFFFGKVPGLPSSILAKLQEIMVLDGLKIFFIKLLSLANDIVHQRMSIAQARIEIMLLLMRLHETANTALSAPGKIVTYGQTGINGILEKLPVVIRGPIDNILNKIKIPMPADEFEMLKGALGNIDIGDLKRQVTGAVSAVVQ